MDADTAGSAGASTLSGHRNTNHTKLNDDLGVPGDPATQALDKFLAPLKGS